MGRSIVINGELSEFVENTLEVPESLKATVSFHNLSEEDLQIPLKTNKANIIEIIPNSLLTRHLVEEVDVNKTGMFQPSIKKDQLTLTVIERHKMTRLIGLGIVKGLGLKEGAIATTVAHDSHNLIIAGVNDSDILFAANEIKSIQGGLVVVKNGEVLADLQLPIAGLISPLSYQEVFEKLQRSESGVRYPRR